jgi:hypothetical protein
MSTTTRQIWLGLLFAVLLIFFFVADIPENLDHTRFKTARTTTSATVTEEVASSGPTRPWNTDNTNILDVQNSFIIKSDAKRSFHNFTQPKSERQHNDVSDLRRQQAIDCYTDLFAAYEEQFLLDHAKGRPLVNSIRRSKTGEIVIFFSFARNTNMKHPENSIYMESTWYCDDWHTNATVIKHNRKFSMPHIKMTCPSNTTTRIFADNNQLNVSYVLEPFLNCDDMMPALLPRSKETAQGQPQKPPYTVACTQVKYKENLDAVCGGGAIRSLRKKYLLLTHSDSISFCSFELYCTSYPNGLNTITWC